jgi:hypothetical protein
MEKPRKILNIPIAFLVLFLVAYLVKRLTGMEDWAYVIGCIVAFISGGLLQEMDREKVKTFKKVISIKKYLKE